MACRDQKVGRLRMSFSTFSATLWMMKVVDKWNVLTDSCMECTTLNDFKTKIKLLLELETQI